MLLLYSRSRSSVDPNPDMNRQTLRRALAVAVQLSEWLVLAFLLAASIPPILIRHGSLRTVPKLSLIGFSDASWLLDTSYKAAGGIWFGRDVAFTYGPLFQWLSSAPSRWIGLSAGAIFATWYTLPLLFIVVATFLTARLLLAEAPAWRRAVFVLLAVVFWSPPDLRISFCLLAFAIFLRLTDAAASGDNLTLRALASSALCVSAFWVSADTGIYTAAAFLLCLASTGTAKRRTGPLAAFAIVAAVFFAGFVLLTNAALLSLLDFRFWRSSLAIANGYRWFEPSAMSKHDTRLLLGILAVGIVVFTAAWRWRKPGGSWTSRPAFPVAGFCLGFIMLQSALVRSDHAHLLVGIYPMIFLCGAVAMDGPESGRLSILLLAAAVVATLVLATPYPLFRPASAISRWREVLHPLRTCPPDRKEFDRACFTPADAELLSTVSGNVDLHTAPTDRIAVFPYETAFGLASRRQIAGGVLQSYLVNGEYLTGLELAGLRRSNPPFGLYLPDGVMSGDVDSVPNFTRSPSVWFYLLHHYRAEGSPRPGVLGLLRDDSRNGRLSFTGEEVVQPLAPVKISKPTTAIDIAPLRWPDAGADFLKVRVRVNYPAWWRVRKPSRTRMQLSYANGTERLFSFVLQPNQSCDIWIYPWDEREMGSYFSDDELQRRSGNRPALTGLKLLVDPYDWASVIPGSVEIAGVEAVRLNLK